LAVEAGVKFADRSTLFEGHLGVATIAEQAAWRARAVEAQLSSEKAYEFFATLTAGRRRALG